MSDKQNRESDKNGSGWVEHSKWHFPRKNEPTNCQWSSVFRLVS